MLVATIDFIEGYSDGADRRAGAGRVTIDQPSTLRAPRHAALDIAVQDLSARGFRFVSDHVLPIGAVVRIGLCGAGVQEARIVRRDGDGYGCAFLEPLSTARMATAFTAAAVVQGQFAANDTGAAPIAQPVDTKWPRQIRLAVLALGSVAAWAAALSIGWLLLH